MSALAAGEWSAETDEVMYRLPFVPLATLPVLGPLLGVGHAALDLAVDNAPQKAMHHTFFARQSDSVGVQVQIAQATLMLETAQLHAYHSADELRRGLRRRHDADLRGPGPRCAGRVGYAAPAGARPRSRPCSTCTARRASARPAPMQRHWRDASTGARHAGLNSDGGAARCWARRCSDVRGADQARWCEPTANRTRALGDTDLRWPSGCGWRAGPGGPSHAGPTVCASPSPPPHDGCFASRPRARSRRRRQFRLGGSRAGAVAIDREELPAARHTPQLDGAAIVEASARADDQVADSSGDEDVTCAGLAEDAQRCGPRSRRCQDPAIRIRRCVCLREVRCRAFGVVA